MLLTKARCHWYQTWDHLAKGHPEDCYCLPASPKAQPPKKPRSVGKLGEEWSQEVTRMRQALFTRSMQIQIWLQGRGGGGGLNTGKMVPTWPPCGKRAQYRCNGAVPPGLSLQPHNSASPCMSPAPLEPLSLCWRPE